MVTGVALSERWYYSSGGLLVRAQRGEYNFDPGSGGGPGDLTEYDRRQAKFYSGVTPLYGGSTKKPALTDVGNYPGVTRTNFNASTTQSVIVSVANTTWENLNVWGDVKIRAANFKAINCRFYGGPQSLGTNQDSGICDMNNVAAVNGFFLDCHFQPQKPDSHRDAILGHKYTAERCYAKNTCDGFGAYAHPTQAGVTCGVTLLGNYVEEMVYWPGDNDAHADGTHNDCVQYQGGDGLLVRGNVFIASSIKSIWPGSDLRYGAPWSVGNPAIEPYDVWVLTGLGYGKDKNTAGVADLIVNGHANGAGIILQDNVGKGTTNVVVDGNWVDNGLACFNLKPTSGGGAYTITNNRLGANSYEYSPGNKFGFRIDRKATTAFTTPLLSAGNVWEAGNVALTESLTGGVRYDA